ncbi:MAG: hypothetical protein ACOY4I_04600 [Bacillota bacterium]
MAKGKVLEIRKDITGTWQEALEGFLFWKQAQGLSETTLKDYRTHVSIFLTASQKRLAPRS